jgi:hypothetical protein
MQELLIFLFLFFLAMQLFYIYTCLLVLLFLLKVLQKNQNSIQTNQQTPCQPDIDSLLNIVELISQSKPL